MPQRIKKRDIHVTLLGISSASFKDELHLAEMGYNLPEQCYLCKRQKGDKSVAIRTDQKEPKFPMPPIEL